MAKKRVHEIAKAQGLTSKELLAKLKTAGVEAKAAQSSVEESDALAALKGSGDGAATATATATATTTAISPETGWLDVSHTAVSKGLLEAIGWFDNFFADRDHLEFERNGSTLLLREELRLEDTPRIAPAVDMRIDLRLPQLGSRFERWHLVVYAQHVAEDVANRIASLGGGGAGPGLAQPGDPGQSAAELRYDVVSALLARVDVGGGLHIQIPPGGYLRTRLRSSVEVAPRWVARLAQSAFYDSFQRFGTSSHAELEHQLATATLLRWDGVAFVTQASRGWEWGSEVSALHALGPSHALALTAGFLGHGRGGPVVDRYRVSSRLRAGIFRRWLFVELEPEVAWPLDAITLTRRRVLAVSVRLDVLFGSEGSARAEEVAHLPSPRGSP
jgi:hypothetical protein